MMLLLIKMMLPPLAIIIGRGLVHIAVVVDVDVAAATEHVVASVVANVRNAGAKAVILSVGVKTVILSVAMEIVILSVSVFGIVSIVPRLFVGGARVFKPIDDVVQLQWLVLHFPEKM